MNKIFKVLSFTGFAAASMLAPYLHADVTIATWNIKHLGWKNGKNYAVLGEIGSVFDLLAVQEVMSEEGAAKLHRSLEAASNESWAYTMSHLIGRSSYKEAYAFFWRESEVASAGGDVVFFDGGDVFAREPYSALFTDRDTNETFALSNVHILYGDGVSDRLPEIEALSDYWQWLGDEVYPDVPRILVGDFNLDSEHLGFDTLEQLGVEPSYSDGRGTTISTTEGRYPNHYDHIFLQRGSALNVTDQGILRFPEKWGITHDVARDSISDHVPVWIALNSASLRTNAELDEIGVTASSESTCIDLNESPVSALDQLPHVGGSRAQEVIEGRPWSSASNLIRVNGLSAGRVEEIMSSGLLCH
ncbi:endonuclease/exonuclease/phosphatase family protein [Vreelandella massiliensis]|uniref:endonuclease/exonuclease/phosphatase family protein n=1 Tax=Vreelandella massiliensis TaxID=1816686 RepID=UPI00096AC535|nr:endonuclease/exonuclease/phosphatase family protein [Halomonas massiliensis]